MFDSGDPQMQNDTQGGMTPQGITDNCSFSMSMPPAAPSMMGAPAPMAADTSSAMPAADELAAGASPAPSMSRDAQAQTPDDLMSIKQGALQDLKPLVGHLDQSAEERFRMTMMMIQATDDQGLIPDAYDAAKAIEDEKTRAQALLDVVNEINYFTQQNKQ